MGANKRISCKICSLVMISDILKRPMKNHVDLELGNKINHGVRQQSLRSEYKEALDFYMNDSVNSFSENIEFKPWQISILEEVEIPTERKIIWVVGKSCGEGKTWLQNYYQI